MKAFISISVATAILTGVVLVSCSPEPHAYLKDQAVSVRQGQPVSEQSSAHKNGFSDITGSQAQANSIFGDWQCASEDCDSANISLSKKEGSVMLTSNDQDSIQLSELYIEDHIQFDEAHPNELVLNGDRYIRKPSN
jgi:hypothetical protein